ncbi:hypothetical protein [Actinomadura roseirufa]|uniref:hypothetical protein n=1 Tax=Actinomadura roseirufa TaxID=2094049 RepID=UPI001040F7D3|nr:hypothetical protein [Actinomadura roseirufa]
MTAEHDEPPGDDRTVGRLAELAGRVLASAGVLTAILYYFGYVREQALYTYFGVDLGTVGFTTTDYVVLSAGPVFAPLASAGVLGVGVLIAHHLLVHLMRDASHRWRGVMCACLVAVALTLLTIGAVSLHLRGDRAVGGPYFSPMALLAGAVLLEYAAENATAYGVATGTWSEILASTRALRRLLVVVIALVAAFWATANVAQRHGLNAARAAALSLPISAEAFVYAKERLQISGQGVTMVRLSGRDSAFAYLYKGLRILAHQGGHWILLPVGWTRDNGERVILLPDSGSDLRVELAP